MPGSSRPGMGAVPYHGGVTFRVWAPFATSVHVAGSFNGWNEGQAALSADGSGYWSADVAGAKLGDRYKYVIRSPFEPNKLWKNDPYAREMQNSAGDTIVGQTSFAWGGGDFRMPARNELVIYELHVGTFHFSAQGRNGRGTLRSLVQKLDYLADLGVNAIQIMPADEFSGDISWGYNPSYLFAIEESYGGSAAFHELVDAAHLRGLAVIFDVVFNHLGPDDLDHRRFDGWRKDNGEGIYFYNDHRVKTPWGFRPDYGRSEVRRYLRDCALYWLEERYCDGLRFDSTANIRKVDDQVDGPANDLPDGWALMQGINAEIRARQPWKLTIAEDLKDDAALTRSGDGAGFGAQWASGFREAIRNAVLAPSDEQRSMSWLRDELKRTYNGDAFQKVIYAESHDEADDGRLPELIAPGQADSAIAQKRSALAAAVVLTAPGIPMLFMGQEFLEWGRWSDAVGLDWSKLQRFSGLHQMYRDLIRLRRNWFDHTRGLEGAGCHVHTPNETDKVLVYHRWDRGGPRDDVVVIANFGHRAFSSYRIGLPRSGTWRVRFNGDWRGYSPAFGDHPAHDVHADSQRAADGQPAGADISLGACTAVILSQDD